VSLEIKAKWDQRYFHPFMFRRFIFFYIYISSFVLSVSLFQSLYRLSPHSSHDGNNLFEFLFNPVLHLLQGQQGPAGPKGSRGGKGMKVN
jgi:hypothetical protein